MALLKLKLVGMHVAVSSKVVPISRFHVDALSPEAFDELYLDKLPVILSGTSTCPRGLTVDTIGTVCHGDVKHYVRYKNAANDTGSWAGLKRRPSQDALDIADFARGMGSSEHLRFVFDLPMYKICPSLVPNVMLPPHFVRTFIPQSEQRGMSSWSPKKCINLPFYNVYMAEAGFESDLHVDRGHTAFTASMCWGQKLWRVVTLQNFSTLARQMTDHSEDFIANHTLADGSTVHLRVKSPYDTWSPGSPLLGLDDIVIYEGVLSPGETIFIPPGAPHAAITLNQSMMVASNALTVGATRQIWEFCTMHNGADQCTKMKDQLDNHQKYTAHLPRVQQSFLESIGCEKISDDLAASTVTALEHAHVIDVDPSTLDELLSRGPLLLFKLSSTCLPCIKFKKQLPDLIDRFSPRLQIGILSPGKNYSTPSAKTLLVRSGLLPEVIFMAQERTGKGFRANISGNMTTFNFTRRTYFGFRLMDMVLVWASIQSGSSVSGVHPVLHIVLFIFEWAIHLLVLLVEACGYTAFADGRPWPGSVLPDGGSIAVAGLAVGLPIVISVAWCLVCKCCKRNAKPKSE